MSAQTPTPVDAEYAGRPFYGYDSDAVQDGYTRRGAEQVAGFLLPRLSPGMSVLDCGCGPGAITFGLAESVAPGRVVGIDLEPTMIERSRAAAAEQGAPNAEFRVANIYDLPFADAEFDVAFSSAVTEHLSEPTRALEEMRRVVKPGGLAAVINTDWTFPFIVPECPELSRFFELFEGGFQRIGGSLNRGRFLRGYMREAGFDVVEFAARVDGSADRESVEASMARFVEWIQNIPLFQESIELGLTTDAELASMADAMRAWARHPNAYFATASCYAVGVKRG